MSLNFESIFNDYKSYVENLNNEFQNKLIVHVHIPKTAGTSFLSLVRKYYSEDDINVIGWEDIHNNFDKYLLEWDKGKECKFLTGHFRNYDFSKFDKRNVDYRVITFLRNPIDRLISEYRYMCTEAHPIHKEFLQEHPTFESFALSDMVIPNSLSTILVGHFNSVYDVIDRMQERYLFVGLSEYYHLYAKVLFDGLSIPYQIEERKNITKSTDKNKFDIEYRLYQKLTNIHSIDMQLYEYLQSNTPQLINNYIEYGLNTNS